MTGGKPSRGVQQSKLDKFTKVTKPRETLYVEEGESQRLPDKATSEEIMQPSLADIMTALQGVRTTLETKIDAVSTEITLLRADFHKMRDRVTETEKNIVVLRAENQQLKQQVQGLQRTTTAQGVKLDDLEGRSRRNNIRITGVPEKAEGRSADLFVEDLIKEGLRPHGLSNYFSVERAHRIPGFRPTVGAPPRTIIARIFNFRDRDLILQEASVAPPVKYENATIQFFPDFTLQVQKQRRSFLEIKRRLREQNYKYAMLYPAKLRVAQGEKAWFFNTAEEAAAWLEQRPKDEAANRRSRPSKEKQQGRRGTTNTVMNAGGESQDLHSPINNTLENSPRKRTDWFDGDDPA